jgi:hypothetical protein
MSDTLTSSPGVPIVQRLLGVFAAPELLPTTNLSIYPTSQSTWGKLDRGLLPLSQTYTVTIVLSCLLLRPHYRLYLLQLSFIAGTIVIQLVEIIIDKAIEGMPSSPSVFEVAASLLLVFANILPRDKLS